MLDPCVNMTAYQLKEGPTLINVHTPLHDYMVDPMPITEKQM